MAKYQVILLVLMVAILALPVALALPTPAHYYNATANYTGSVYSPLEDYFGTAPMWPGNNGPDQTASGFRGDALFYSNSAGGDVYLYSNASDGFRWTNNASFCMWVNHTNPSDGQGMRLMQLGNVTPNDQKLEFYIVSGNFGVYNSVTAQAISLTYPAAANQWWYLCAAMDFNTQEMWLYVNGSLFNYTSGFIPAGGFPNDAASNVEYTKLGQRDSGAPDNYLDEISIFDSTLSSTEVSDLYNAGTGSFWEGGAWTYNGSLPTPAQNMLYKFENASDLGYDSTGYMNLSDISSVAQGAGTSGYGMEFTATGGGYVGPGFPTSQSPNWTTNAYTMCAWVWPNGTTEEYVNFGSATGGGLQDWLWLKQVDGYASFSVVESGSSTSYGEVNSTTMIPQNSWTYLCGVYNSTDISLYVDGLLNGTISHTGLVDGNTSYILIGEFALSPGNNQGTRMDEVSFNASVLTASEIFAQYNATRPVINFHYAFENDSDLGHDSEGNMWLYQTNDVAQNSGVIGYGLEFNGTGSWLGNSGVKKVTGNGNATLCVWVRPLTNSDTQDLVTYGSYNGQWEATLGQTNGYVSFGTIDQGTCSGLASSVNSTNVLPANRWSHVCGVIDADSLDLYVNGQLDATAGVSESIATNDSVVNLGAFCGGTVVGAKMDEVYVKNTALSASDIYALWNATAPAAFNWSGLIHYYPWNDGTYADPVGYDVVGSNDFTRDGNVVFNQTAIAVGSGGGNKSLSVGYVSGPDNLYATGDTCVPNNDSFTISLWVNFTSAYPNSNSILVKQNDSSAEYVLHLNWANNDGTVYLNVWDAGGNLNQLTSGAGIVPALGEYMMFTIRKTGDNLSLWMNGSLVAYDDTVSGVFDSAIPCFLGPATNGPTAQTNAYFDDVAVFNRPLSDAEIVRLYADREIYDYNFSLPPCLGAQITNASEYMWYRGDKGTCDAGQAGNYLETAYGSAAMDSGNTIIYNASFSATDQNSCFYSAANTTSFSGNIDETMCFWGRPTSSTIALDFVAISNTVFGVYAGDGNWFGYESDELMFATNSYNAKSGGPIPVNTWIHSCVVYDSASTNASFYQNGTYVGSQILAGTPNWTNPAVALGNVIASGYPPCGGISAGFQGQYNDVRVYNRTISSGEVAFLYNAGLGTNQSLSEYSPLVPPTLPEGQTVYNTSFEDDNHNWTVYGGSGTTPPNVTTAHAHTGVQSYSLGDRDSGIACVNLTALIPPYYEGDVYADGWYMVNSTGDTVYGSYEMHPSVDYNYAYTMGYQVQDNSLAAGVYSNATSNFSVAEAGKWNYVFMHLNMTSNLTDVVVYNGSMSDPVLASIYNVEFDQMEPTYMCIRTSTATGPVPTQYLDDVRVWVYPNITYPTVYSVELLSPANGSIVVPSISLYYAVNASAYPVSCSLFINDSSVDTTLANSQTPSPFTYVFTPGSYSWYVQCSGGVNVVNSTEVWELTAFQTTLSNITCETTYPYEGDVPMAKMPVNFTVDDMLVSNDVPYVQFDGNLGVCNATYVGGTVINSTGGPVHEYTFDSATVSGGVVADLAGFENGTFTNIEYPATGYRNEAPGFTYAAQPHVDFNYSMCYTPGPFTFTAWVYLNETGLGNNYILGTRSNPASGSTFAWYLGTTGQPSFALFTSAGTSQLMTNASASFSLNTWTHFAVVSDGTDWYMYKNGTLIRQYTPPTSALMRNNGDTTTPCSMGYSSVLNLFGFSGYIDDLRMYHTALSAAEIGQEMINTLPAGNTSYVVNATGVSYNCLVNVSILQTPGTYPVNVTYTDDDDYVSDSATMCTIGGVIASVRVGDTVTFSGAGPGLVNVSGDQAIVLKNTGNTPLGVYMTGYNLVGRSQPGVTLSASAFYTGASLPASVQMAHGVQKNLSMSVNPGQNSSILFWLSMPPTQLVQDYYAAIPWQVVGLG